MPTLMVPTGSIPVSGLGTRRSSSKAARSFSAVAACAGAVNPGKEDEELLASPAGDDIGGPHGSGEQVCCLPQDLVTLRMAEAVVDRLEVVDIGDQNRPSSP
jgi:hypothetical protein